MRRLKPEIRRFKVALTSACPHNCAYCFSNKREGSTLDEDSCRAAVRLILATPGWIKKLYVYGGEPLLRFELLKKVILWSQKEAARSSKRLAVLVSTGGTAVRREHLEFFRDNDVGLCFSMDGGPEAHNLFRRYRNGRETFTRLLAGVELAFKMIPSDRLGVSQGVHPLHARHLFENYRYLLSLGFKHTNLEIVQGIAWSRRQKDFLKRSLLLKKEFLLREISRGNFLFPLSISERLASTTDAAYTQCPFHSSFELFPDGSYSFYPYPFLASAAERAQARIGTAQGGLSPKFKDCRFSPSSGRCARCLEEYYVLGRFNDNEPSELRIRTAMGMVSDILEAAGRGGVFASYVRESLKRSMKGFG